MDKTELRQAAIRARAKLPGCEREAASRAICELLWAMPEVQNARVIFSYLAMPEEADLSALHALLLERGRTVAFPVTGKNGAMEAYAPDASMRFATDRFGIRVPVTEAARRIDPREIDLVLTPCVAFDTECRRLGHGGGFYDRYFPRCPRAIRICIAFEAQRLPEIPAGPWDAPMHAVVTEAGIRRAE